MALLKWMEKWFWFEKDEPMDTGKTHERIGVYMTGTGDHSHQPYVKHGRTFYIQGEGDETIRQQFELDANKLKKYDVYRFNPITGEFDIPSVEKLRVLPRNAIVFSNDRTLSLIFPDYWRFLGVIISASLSLAGYAISPRIYPEPR